MMEIPTSKEEQDLYSRGYHAVVGIDEAGRGAWAGPVVAASVILDMSGDFARIDEFGFVRDSKKISEKRREDMFEKIIAGAMAVGVGIIGNEEIDSLGILRATEMAMHESIRQTEKKVDFALVDDVPFKEFPVEFKPIVRGDGKVISIAAASIVAKVTRDRIMRELAEAHPEYGFDGHKGYGTQAHRQAMEKHGVLEIHRKSYAPVGRILLGDA